MKNDFHVRSFITTYYGDWKDYGFHQNDTLEISILLEGQGVFEWMRRKYTIEAGQVILVPPYLHHRYEGMNKNRYGVMHLGNIPTRLMELFSELVNDSEPTIIVLSRLDKERFERLFRELLRISSLPLKNKQRNYEAWVEVIILFLIEHSQKDQQALTVTRAADYIRENLQHGIQISALAELAGLTEPTFRRLFEEIYHMSPKQYQQQSKMSEAKWLLSSSNKEVQEIAEQVGFARLHSFSQWFKKQEGVSPSEWRKNLLMRFGD